MYENKNQPLLAPARFLKRVAKNLLFAFIVIAVCLVIGILGYHYSAGIGWLDSLHNASMILSGMGPVVTIDTVPGKWFSSFYALFSGVVFITNIGIVLAPLAHRIFHRLHLDDKEDDTD